MCLIYPLPCESLMLMSALFLSGEHRASLIPLGLNRPVAILPTCSLRQQISNTTVTRKAATEGPQISIGIQVAVKARGLAEAQEIRGWK